MSVLIPLFISLLFFFIGYIWYADKLEKTWAVKQHKQVPAHLKFDGIDYVPARHWTVLFGHHFSSIAGAAPIIGPIIAVSLWGWVPGLIWIVLGSVFLGGVHDFGSLITSVREGGRTIGDVSSKVLSKKAKILFLFFLWFTLILVIAVFVNLCAKTFIEKPNIVIPSWSLIGVALFSGFLMSRTKLNTVLITVLSLLMLVFFIYVGSRFPVVLPFKNALFIWISVLLAYSLIASVVPVNILLQPRDYLSAYLLIAGIIFGFSGLVVSGSKIKLAAFNGFNSNIGPMWPMLLVTIACGAISGFHSLISSGTTSKQLPDEIDAKKIGYGAMITEAFLALIALFLIAVEFKDSPDLIIRLKEVSPIGVFGEAFGKSTKSFLGVFGAGFAIIVLNAFIFTTLDTAARVGRYITHELFNIQNSWFASFVVVFLGGLLAFSGQWIKIWPLFGAANQLVAALTLIVLTSWLLNKGKYIRYTFLPAVFMLITALGALLYQFYNFVKQKNIVLMSLSLLLMFLSFFMCFEAVRVYVKQKKEKNEKNNSSKIWGKFRS